MSIDPLLGLYTPVIWRMRVDLPAPLGPTRPYMLPLGTVRVILFSALNPSKFLVTPVTSSSGLSIPADLSSESKALNLFRRSFFCVVAAVLPPEAKLPLPGTEYMQPSASRSLYARCMVFGFMDICEARSRTEGSFSPSVIIPAAMSLRNSFLICS